MSSSVVLLASDGTSTRIVYNALVEEFGDVKAILESPVSKRAMLQRRLKRLGPVKVAGQVMFMGTAYPWLVRATRARQCEIVTASHFDTSSVEPAEHVTSVNSTEARERLGSHSPQVVVVNGTRIIGAETLGCVGAPFINMHAGVTPAFRGVHGGYWALRQGRPDVAGTTVHLVDRGIDTGPVLAQAMFTATPADAFTTYPLLQLQVGIPLLVDAVRAALQGRLEPTTPVSTGLPSRLWSHPTLWEYLGGRFTRVAR